MKLWNPRASNHGTLHPRVLPAVLILLAACLPAARAQVVINEIHYNPDKETDRVEFVELHNPTAQPVSLAGWQFSRGIAYTFGPGVAIPAGGYAVVAQDPGALAGKFFMPFTTPYGPYQGKLDSGGEQITLVDTTGRTVDSVTYGLGFPWPTVGDPVPATSPGTGRSIQLINPALDNDLGGSWRSAYPTPGLTNSAVLADNPPPQIRQVTHEPAQPRPGDTVLISAKVTDADGVATVTLSYQLVDPGAYIALADAAYQTNWTKLAMNDAGQDGDLFAGDSIYSARIPAALQTHRRLVRYRIQVADRGGRALTVPYPDDPQPNFAYFVYGGVPPFVASKHPGVDPEEVFTTATMNALPIYHLITKKSDTEGCTWRDWDYSNAWRYHGTLVYDGQVLDHIAFRARGGVWRFANRKNMWKFDLNRGHDLEVRDAYGKKIKTKRSQLNFGSALQMGNYKNRGEAGLYETLGYKLLGMVGMQVPELSYIHFRIIDEAGEDGRLNAAHAPLTTAGTQFDGDFWGLYTLVEEINGRFIDEHNLPDGNLYKMEGGTGALKNTNPYGPTDKSDLNAFMSGYKARPASPWWRANTEIEQYFGYRSIIECIHHYDIAAGKNYFFFNNPENHRWAIVPWDINQSWALNMYGTGEEPYKVYGALSQPDLFIGYQNRLREVRDLLFNPDQTGQLINEWASAFYTPGLQSFVDADRALWDYHWVQSDAACTAGYADKSGRAGLGTFFQIAPTKDFAGMLKIMRDWVVSRGAWVDTNWANDPQIPSTPLITADCPLTYPSDALRFRASAFNGNSTGTFAALQYRLAEVEPFAPAQGGTPPWHHFTAPGKYEIKPVWQSAELTSFTSAIDLPTTAALAGHTYRARVRMQDTTGRWSHWSAPLQFVAGPPASPATRDHLRISEVMYHPLEGAVGSLYTEDDFEFIELKNISQVAVNLSGVALTDGVTAVIPAGDPLQPGECAVVVKNSAAFRQRYGSAPRILAQFTGKLANSGELLRLADATGATITQFEFSDGRGWPQAADGGGHSLVPLTYARDAADGPLDYGLAWRPSALIGGSPGQDDPEPPASVVINEFLANSGDGNDWVELINPTTATITLDNYYLSDDVANPRKWKIPAQAIAPGERLVFDALTGFNANPTTGFVLSQYGEQVVLAYLPGTAQDRIIEAATFKAQERGVSLGRYPDGGAPWHYPLLPGRGTPNRHPQQHAVINEIMYHPLNDAPAGEFIEIYNPYSAPLELWNATGPWRVSGGVDFQFPAGATVAPGACALLVGFNPADATAMNDFLARYGLSQGAVTIWGPYTGSLSNRCDRICLERPKAPELPGDPLEWVIVDEVIYVDQYPFTPDADGSGKSLQRVSLTGHGWDPANWKAANPTAGAAPGAVWTRARGGWRMYD